MCVSWCVILVVKLFTQLVQRLHNNLQSGSFSLTHLKVALNTCCTEHYIIYIKYKFSRWLRRPVSELHAALFRDQNAICMFAIFGDGARGRKWFFFSRIITVRRARAAAPANSWEGEERVTHPASAHPDLSLLYIHKYHQNSHVR